MDIYLTHQVVPHGTALREAVYIDVNPEGIDEARAVAELLDIKLSVLLSAVVRTVRFGMQPNRSHGFPGFPGPCWLLPRGIDGSCIHLHRFRLQKRRILLEFTVRYHHPGGFRVTVLGVEAI